MKKLVLATAMLALAAPAFAEEPQFGGSTCQRSTHNCVIFLKPMPEERLLAAGMSFAKLESANERFELVRGADGKLYAPALTWLDPNYEGLTRISG